MSTLAASTVSAHPAGKILVVDLHVEACPHRLNGDRPSAEGLLEIRDEVLRMLDPDREPDQRIGHLEG